MVNIRERSYVPFPNRRLLRAQVIAHQILQTLEPWLDRFAGLEQIQSANGQIPADPRKHIYRLIMDSLVVQGAEVITDADRAMAGLPWRDKDGMTEIELKILEDYRVQTMMRAVSSNPLAGSVAPMTQAYGALGGEPPYLQK